MAGASAQSFTLSELVKYTGMNTSSCHSILNVLVNHGYLTRHPAQKTYRLAPALAAIGASVMNSDPTIQRATLATEELARRTGLEVLLSARAGDETIKLARRANPSLPRVTMRIGQRSPLIPPLGAPFVAWADEAGIEDWLAKGSSEPGFREASLALLDLVRKRGFLVALRRPTEASPRALVTARSKRTQDDQPAIVLDPQTYQPQDLLADASYDIDVISAPIFDVHHQVIYTLSIVGTMEPMKGAQITELARTLLEVCRDSEAAWNLGAS